MDSPELWRWVWLAVAAGASVGEMTSGGSLVVLPFAVGAGAAAVLAFAGVDVRVEWLTFVVVSVVGVVATRPLARRLDVGASGDGVGARRWIGRTATVLEDIPPGPSETGLVRLGREEWRAESLEGRAIARNVVVKVVDVAGTRLVVGPLDQVPEAADRPTRTYQEPT